MNRPQFDPRLPCRYVRCGRTSSDKQDPRRPDQRFSSIDREIRRQGRTQVHVRDDHVSGRWVENRAGQRRDIKAHRADEHHAEPDRHRAAAYPGEDHEQARASLEATARWLSRLDPDAAASPRETPTVVHPGLTGPLRRTPCSANPTEAAASVTRRVTSRVTRRRDGDMRRRRCVAGRLRAGSKSRRVKGHRAIGTFPKALGRLVREAPSGEGPDVP
jgi:hypothetical protein